MKKQLFTFLSLLITGITSAQVGIGTTDPKSSLEIQGSLGFKVNTFTTATTLDDTYHVVLCNNAPYTVTLPPAASNAGRVYRIKNIDPSGDAITIDGNGSETIDGDLTYALQPYKHSITIISDGANWHVIENLYLGGAVVGTISTLNCGSATDNGTLVSGIAASSVSSEIPYSGGNSGTHDGDTVTSTGVTGLTANLSSGVFASSGSLTYTITGTPASSGTATFALNIGGQTCNLTRTVNPGLITALTCGSATDNGTLVHGVAASGVNSVVPYTGGNAGPHSGQTVASTGVTGLTATLTAGNFADGSGNLTYTITGTPASSGTATFALNIGGQTCTLTRTVSAGEIASINCSGTNNGTLVNGVAASGVNSVLSYTGGNAGTHSGQTVTSTGVTGLTATLSAGTFANGAGSLTYTITGTPSGSGTASFAINIGGQTCTLTRTVSAGEIASINCSGTDNGTLVNGVAASGVNSVLSYTGGNAGTHSGQTVTSTGVTGLTATLSAGTFANGAGTLTYTITGTPASNGTASFAVNIGGQTCTLTRTVAAGAISTIDCAGATDNGTLTDGVAASGVNSVLSYTGGNAGTHSGQTVTSTGVTGLTATLSSGTFASGAGTLTYTITGTPSGSGTASFAINIGGQTCTLDRTVDAAVPNCGTVTFTYNGASVTYGTVLSSTGECWLDRNLGASQVATSSTDVDSYGDYFQWGRGDDGHQESSSSTTSTNSNSPGHSDFITETISPFDWRSTQDDNLWNGESAPNNPCPSGWRIPTDTEWSNELTSENITNAASAYNSVLKLSMAGRRVGAGTLSLQNTRGDYYASTVSGIYANNLYFNSSSKGISTAQRVQGYSVRCIKD